MSITVRPVAAAEHEEFLDWFARYWTELETFNDFADPFSREQYGRLLREPEGRRFWWADRDGRHIGFCVFIIGPHWYRRDITDGYVDEFYIEPDARRGGAGRELATLMLDEMHGQKVREIRLSVLRRNERAAAFWSTLGFATEMTRMALRPGGDQPE